MFFKKFLMLPALLLAASGVRAQTDTLQAKVQEVQITASHESRFAVGSRYVKVDSLALEQYRSSSLADLLQRYTPLYFKTYGHGMLATVSFRGTAANHTAVLWNGLNISLPTLGLTDFSTIPATALTSVAVQHGPAGANYGSASLGGTVLLGSELEFGKQLKIETRQETGSFGYRYHSGAVQAGNKKLVSRTSYFYSEAENNFKYKDITAFRAPVRTEEHAAVWQKGITQDVQYKASLRTQVALRGMYSYNDREIQAAMGSNHGNAKQQDENLRLLAELNHLSGFGETTVKAAFFKDVLDYTANMVDSDSEVHTWQLQVAHEKQLTSKLDLKTGINAQYFIADVSGYGSRKTENRASAFVLLRYNPLPRLHLNLNWRQARIEDYGAAPAPSLGAEYLLWQKKQAQVTVKGNASRSYRVPSLNERFWPTGDPHLKPESGFGYEAGVRFTNEKGAFTTTAEATVYQMQVQNWVQWQPVNDGWSPVNLQQVKSSGLEAAASVAYKQQQTHFKLSSAYYYTRSTQTEEAAGYAKQNQLIFVPLHSATTTAFISKKGWFANSQFTYTSSRYTNPSNTSLVEGFALLNAVAGKTVTYKTFQLELSAKVNNITNQVYQNMDYRAMPLRHYSLCLRITYNHQYKN